MSKRFHTLELTFNGRWIATVHDERLRRAERLCRMGENAGGRAIWEQWDYARQGVPVPRGMRLEAEEAYQQRETA